MLVFNKCSFNYNFFLFISKIQKKNTSEAKMYLNIEYLMIYCLKLNFDACWCIFNSKSLLNHLDGEKNQSRLGTLVLNLSFGMGLENTLFHEKNPRTNWSVPQTVHGGKTSKAIYKKTTTL